MADPIKLMSFAEEHVCQTYEWMCDKRLRHAFLMRGDMTWDNHVSYCNRMMSDLTQVVYAVFAKDNYIGNCGFKNVIKKTEGEFWIYIGAMPDRGKGIGKSVTKRVVQKGFGDFQFKKIYLHVADFNTVARTMYEGLGFGRVPLKESDDVWKDRGCKVVRMERERS